MQQKVVIKVPLNGKKSRCKALKIAVGIPGVTSVALTGQEMNQLIEVIGDGIDIVTLTTLLRKNVGYSELVSVGPVPGDNDDGSKGGDDKAPVQVPVGGYYYYPYPYAYEPGHMYEIRDQNPGNCCMM